MATTKPRITITLTERQHEVLKIISSCGGSSMSALLGEFIEASLPTLERMANTFQKLRQAQTMERAKMIEAMDESIAVLEPIAAAAIDQFDLFLGRIEEASSGITERKGLTPGMPDVSAAAPVTNRGATTTGAKSRKPAAARVSRVSEKSSFSKSLGK